MTQESPSATSTPCHESPKNFLPSTETHSGVDTPMTVRARELCRACHALEKCSERVQAGEFNFPVVVPGIIAATTTAERRAMFRGVSPKRKPRARIIAGLIADEPKNILQSDIPARSMHRRHNSSGKAIR